MLELALVALIVTAAAAASPPSKITLPFVASRVISFEAVRLRSVESIVFVAPVSTTFEPLSATTPVASTSNPPALSISTAEVPVP